MEIIFARHGETTGNVDNRFGVSSDPLTEKGEAQARTLAEDMKESAIEKILVSPLWRAKQTADIVGKILEVEQEIWEDLREIKGGNLEGEPKVAGKNIFELMEEHQTGEGAEAALRRAGGVWEKLGALTPEEGTVLVVAHRTITCVLLALRAGVSADELSAYRKQWEMPNGGWVTVEL